MDRFIAYDEDYKGGDWRTLKSNMDRFIEHTQRLILCNFTDFKIQYG